MRETKKVVAKTLRHKNDKAPETIEIETSFSIGQRINVEYDLPKKRYVRCGYATLVEVKQGKAVGVFEVTDVYLNMLVNLNFTMIELTSRDKEFDRVRPDCKTMLIDEEVVIKRVKSIDEKMIVAGLEKGIIELIDSPHGDGVVCKIGDNWFYFGGEEAERSTVGEYKQNIPKDVIVKDICAVLADFEGEPNFNDEYLYYYCHLCEQMKELVAENTVNSLIDNAKNRSIKTKEREETKIDYVKE